MGRRLPPAGRQQVAGGNARGGHVARLFRQPGRDLLHRRRGAPVLQLQTRGRQQGHGPLGGHPQLGEPALHPSHARHRASLHVSRAEHGGAGAGGCQGPPASVLPAPIRRSGGARLPRPFLQEVQGPCARGCHRQPDQPPHRPSQATCRRLPLPGTAGRPRCLQGLHERPARQPRRLRRQGLRRPLRNLRAGQIQSPRPRLHHPGPSPGAVAGGLSASAPAGGLERDRAGLGQGTGQGLRLVVQDRSQEHPGHPHPLAAGDRGLPGDPPPLAETGLSLLQPSALLRHRHRLLGGPAGGPGRAHRRNPQRRCQAATGVADPPRVRRRHPLSHRDGTGKTQG